VACDILLESCRQRLQLCFRLHLDQRSVHKITYLGVGSLARHKIYYKGEGGGFPQVRAVASLMSPSCLWFILTPKVFQLCINQLVIWFYAGPCELLMFVILPSPIPELQHAPLPPKSASQGTCLNSLLFHCFHFIFTFKSIKELGNMSFYVLVAYLKIKGFYHNDMMLKSSPRC
jgi:hypothetical protein